MRGGALNGNGNPASQGTAAAFTEQDAALFTAPLDLTTGGCWRCHLHTLPHAACHGMPGHPYYNLPDLLLLSLFCRSVHHFTLCNTNLSSSSKGRQLRFVLSSGSCPGGAEVELLYGTIDSQDELIPVAQDADQNEEGSGETPSSANAMRPESDSLVFPDSGCSAWEVVHTYRSVEVVVVSLCVM